MLFFSFETVLVQSIAFWGPNDGPLFDKHY